MIIYDKYFNKLQWTNQITLCKKYFKYITNFTKINDEVVIN